MVGGDRLDDDGLLCDFHALEGCLDNVLQPLRDADLNRTTPFDEINPTAEHVARHIATRMGATLDGALVDGARLRAVRVTEAPGCRATYRMTDHA